MQPLIETPCSPPLKWAGGKRWLAPLLRERFWSKHARRRLVEPFVGGMAVALSLMPERALLNDVNPHLINFYCHLKHGLRVGGVRFENSREVYLANRARFNALIKNGQADTAEAALLFYYLNRTCYNGLCRFNRKGFFNVPFGRYKSITYLTDFGPFRLLLKDWEFRVGDFALVGVEVGDFVYADPPYDVEFTQYSAEDFTWEDQVRLARWLAALDVPVVASNQASERILDLYSGLGFQIEILQAPRRISCNGDRRPSQEMLAYKGV
ncbi:DNA adenine methylase [Meiothermus sp. QL-1]|uniref:DNA adenine methylase n=1 Tax=Meiothermus sp. QL-1 TaxID=2058095 RepID=UPI003511EEA5